MPYAGTRRHASSQWFRSFQGAVLLQWINRTMYNFSTLVVARMLGIPRARSRFDCVVKCVYRALIPFPGKHMAKSSTMRHREHDLSS
eukprot:2360574-Rhodomonas_salina.2